MEIQHSLSVMQHKRSVLIMVCAAHTGVPRWRWNVPNMQLDAAELCRSREQHPWEPSVSHPHSNDLALLITGNYGSADTDELPGIHQPLDGGAGGAGDSTTHKREGIVLTHQDR